MVDPVVRELAGAIADGDPIDWPALEARLASTPDHRVADGLRTLSLFALRGDQAHRQQTPRRLPILFEAVRLLAIFNVAVGLAGALVALQQVEVPRLGVMTSVLVVFAVTAGVLDVGGTDRRTRALATCFWIIASAFSASGVRWIAQQWDGATVLLWFAALHAECFFAASFWQFARDFPILARFSTLDRVCLMAMRATGALGVLLFVANVIPLIAADSILAVWSASYHTMSRGSRFWTLEFGAAIPAILVIGWRGRVASSQESARVRLFLYAVALSVAPVVIEVFLEGLFPAFRAVAATPRWRSIGAWLVYPLIFLLPLATAYAVTVKDVLGFRVVVQRALRNLLARWLVMWSAAVPSLLFMGHLYQHASRPLAEVMAEPAARRRLVASAVGILLLACRPRLLRLVDRWALPGADDRPAVLATMTERMKHARTPLEVAAELGNAAERALQAVRHMYLVQGSEFVPAKSTTAPLPAQSLIPVLLEGSRGPCVVSGRQRHSHYALLTAGDRAWIDAQNVCVVVPIVSGRQGGALLGMVALAERRTALSFSADDLRFLRACAGAASLACDAIGSEPRADRATLEEVGLQCAACGRVEPWEAQGRCCVCGASDWEPALLPTRLLERFVVRRKLGSGGMGVVYQASELALDRDVAIKTLARLSPEAASRLRLEARAMAVLHHPHVAVIFGVEVWRGTPLLTMEYLARGTLADRLRRGPLVASEALRVVTPLSEALHQMHSAGHCHGDIKPSNIGFTTSGVPKFLDFGLAHAIVPDDDSIGRGRTVAGTPAYMSPEMLEGEMSGFASDVWALVVVLYECLTGINPFLSTTGRADIDSHLATRNLAALAPVRDMSSLQRFFRRAFAPLAQRSPQTAQDLWRQLVALDVQGEDGSDTAAV